VVAQRASGDGVGYPGDGLLVGADVLGGLGCAKLLEVLAEVIDRPAPLLAVESEAAPAEPTPHGRRLSQQGEVVHREAVASQAADDFLEVAACAGR
jgi:hypothetical protein